MCDTNCILSICISDYDLILLVYNRARKFSLFVWMADVVPTWVLLLLTLRLQGMKPYRIMTRDLNQYR